MAQVDQTGMTDLEAATATAPASVTTATARKALVALSSVIDERDRLSTSLKQALTDRDAAQAALAAATAQVAALSAQVAALTSQANDLSGALAATTAQRDDAVRQQGLLSAQVAALTGQLGQAATDKAALQAQVDSLGGQVAGLQGQLTAAQAATQGAQAQVAALQAQVVELQAELAAAQQPTPPPTGPTSGHSIVVGASTSDSRLGPLPYERTYSPDAIGRPKMTPVAHSFKQWDSNDLTAWVKGSVDGCTITYFHESEDNIENGKLVASNWTARQKALCKAIIDNNRVGQIRPVVIFMGWSVTHRPDMLAQLVDNELVGLLKQAQGVLGWDVYLQVPADDPKAPTAAVMYGKPQAYSASLGLPWGVFETGTRLAKGTDLSKTVAWWRDAFTWLGQTDNPPTHFLLWNPSTQVKDDTTGAIYSYDFQSVPQIVDLWKQAISAYNPPALRQARQLVEDATASPDERSARRWWQL